jgi:hypothetical protein
LLFLNSPNIDRAEIERQVFNGKVANPEPRESIQIVEKERSEIIIEEDRKS